MKKIFLSSLLCLCFVQTTWAAVAKPTTLDNGYFANAFLNAHPDYCPEVFTSQYTNHIDDTDTCKTFWAELNATDDSDRNAMPAMRALMVIDGLGGQKRDLKQALALAKQDHVDKIYNGFTDEIKERISHHSLHGLLRLDGYANAEADSGPIYQAEADVQSSNTEIFLDKFVTKMKPNKATFASMVNLYNSLIAYATAHLSENEFPAAGDATGNDNLDYEDNLDTRHKFRHLFEQFTNNPAAFIGKNNYANTNDALLTASYAKAKQLEQSTDCQANNMCAQVLDPQQPWLNYRNNFMQFAQSYCAQLTLDQTKNPNTKTCGNYTQQQIALSVSNYLTKERLKDINNVIDSIQSNGAT